jgi:Ca2+-binding EF-hand superfamily protein
VEVQGGTIEADELGMTMKSLGIYLTEDEISELIEAYDENGDGEFDLQEFRNMVCSFLLRSSVAGM